MQNPIISCAVYAAEMLIYYIFYFRVMQGRENVRRSSLVRCMIAGLILFEAGAAVNLLYDNSLIINTISFTAILSAYAIVCFGLHLLPAIGYAIILGAINLALEFGTMFLLSAAFFSGDVYYNSNTALLVTLILISKSLLLLVCLLLSFLLNPSSLTSAIPFHLLFYPMSVTVCLAILWYVCVHADLDGQLQILCAIAAFLMFMSSVILVLTWQRHLESESERRNILRENERLTTERAYYGILERQNQQLGIFAHDMKNHLAAVRDLCNSPRASEYVDCLCAEMKTASRFGHCGNKMLDVIIDRYDIECQMKGITFDCDVRSCNLSQMDGNDLVAVLGNLLDNAVASAAQSAEKHIELDTTFRNSYSVIIVENSCDIPPVSRRGQLISSKDDGLSHGIGLRSVSRVLQKYGGDFEWLYDPDKRIFLVTVMVER